MPELLPCPFCGAQPEVTEEDGYEDIECANVGCLVQPKALGLSERPSRETWNTRALPPDARAVDGDLGVTPEVAEKLLRIREALAHDDIHEAWHWLYKVADSEVESLTPWAKLETRAAAITATNKD